MDSLALFNSLILKQPALLFRNRSACAEDFSFHFMLTAQSLLSSGLSEAFAKITSFEFVNAVGKKTRSMLSAGPCRRVPLHDQPACIFDIAGRPNGYFYNATGSDGHIVPKEPPIPNPDK